MTHRERAKEIIDRLPDCKIGHLLLFLQGMLFDDEIEDALYCQRLVDDYLNDPNPENSETITFEELADELGIELENTERQA